MLFPGEVLRYCDEYACLSVCPHSSKTIWSTFTRFFCMLPVAVARSASDGVAIRYVLLVVRMTSFFAKWRVRCQSADKLACRTPTPTPTSSPTSSRGSSRECLRVVQLATEITSIARVGPCRRGSSRGSRCRWSVSASRMGMRAIEHDKQ